MQAAKRFIVALALSVGSCFQQPTDRVRVDPAVEPAVDVVLNAFAKHTLVALSDGAGHGQVDTRDLYVSLIRDARFHRNVRNVVIEFGNARYQSVMDRYASGAPVARDELRLVWEETTQISGIWSRPMYEEMLAATRAVNARLPAEHRIRVLLGDPPIDWSVVTSPADEDMNDWRDAHFAHVVERDIMRRNDKALLVIGGAHIGRSVVFPNSLIHLLDRRFPGQTWVVGVLDSGRIEPGIRKRMQAWMPPAGAAVRGTWLGKVDVKRIGFELSEGLVEDDVDALLLLTSGPPRLSDATALDPTYHVELSRRRTLAQATLPFRGAQIRFKEDRPAFTADTDDALLAVLTELRRDPGLRLLVKAFADQGESDGAALSMHRAELVVAWLAAHGIERHRLIPKGCGARRPLDFGHTAAGRAMNRRAELVRFAPEAGCDPPW